MNTLTMQQPEVIVVNEQTVTALGRAIRSRIDFEFGWNLCAAYAPVDLCENDSQRNGWWAYLDAEAAGLYISDAVHRGADERTINETIGGQ